MMELEGSGVCTGHIYLGCLYRTELSGLCVYDTSVWVVCIGHICLGCLYMTHLSGLSV